MVRGLFVVLVAVLAAVLSFYRRFTAAFFTCAMLPAGCPYALCLAHPPA